MYGCDCFSRFFIETRRLRPGDRYILRERRFSRSGMPMSIHDNEVDASLLDAERALVEAVKES